MGHSNATTKLPAKYVKEIGRIVVIFACIEHVLRLILYGLLGLTLKQGRLAVRVARIEDCLTLIRDIESVGKTNVAYGLHAITSELKDLEYMRDWFSHGVWTKINGVHHILATSGKWQPPGYPAGIKRKIEPSAHPVTLEQIKGVAAAAQDLVLVVDGVYQHVLRQQKPSAKEHDARHRSNAIKPRQPK